MSLILILGSVGMGKTTLARWFLASRNRRIIVDPMAEHHGDLIASSLDEFLSLFDQELPNPVSLVYRPLADADDYEPYLFDFLMDCRTWTIFIDEVDRFCNPHFIPREFRDLLNFRRHLDIDLILVARRPAAVHRDLSALADRVCIFHTHERRDLDYIRGSVGEEFSSKCANLTYHQYLEANFPPELGNSEDSS